LFFKKNSPEIYHDWNLVVDMHNHILPGIDDGAKNIQESEILLAGLVDLGFKQAIPTPHIASGIHNNDANSITDAFQTLNTPLVNSFAAEYMLDDQFLEQLEKGLLVYPGTGNFVLVEFSYLGKPYNWHELVFEIIKAGYQPILAHPERYQFLTPHYLLEKMVSSGFTFQLNLLSLSGYYGSKIKAIANIYLQEQVYSFAGTDLHHLNHLNALIGMKKNSQISKQISSYAFNNSILS
jgi:tyrosine-protein phosphatase YwqE